MPRAGRKLRLEPRLFGPKGLSQFDYLSLSMPGGLAVACVTSSPRFGEAGPAGPAGSLPLLATSGGAQRLGLDNIRRKRRERNGSVAGSVRVACAMHPRYRQAEGSAGQGGALLGFDSSRYSPCQTPPPWLAGPPRGSWCTAGLRLSGGATSRHGLRPYTACNRDNAHRV